MTLQATVKLTWKIWSLAPTWRQTCTDLWGMRTLWRILSVWCRLCMILLESTWPSPLPSKSMIISMQKTSRMPSKIFSFWIFYYWLFFRVSPMSTYRRSKYINDTSLSLPSELRAEVEEKCGDVLKFGGYDWIFAQRSIILMKYSQLEVVGCNRILCNKFKY